MKNKEKNFASAVIYVHNAENRIGIFLKEILRVMEENFEHSEIICVNDCSNDGSVQKIKAASSSVKATTVTIIHMSYFHGLESAMNAGVDLAIGDFVFEFDHAVLDFDSSGIMDIYNIALKEGYDIVSASPGKKEKLSSKWFYRVFDRFSNLSYKMSTESFRVLSRRVINRIGSMNKTVPYRKAVYANCGLKTKNVRYKVLDSFTENIDKKEKAYRLRLAVDSLILFTDVGYRFSILMTLAMMLIALFMGIYSIIIYVFFHPAEGWTTTVFFLSVSFTGLFGILTIIIKYLQIVAELIFKRKRYSFEEIEKITE